MLLFHVKQKNTFKIRYSLFNLIIKVYSKIYVIVLYFNDFLVLSTYFAMLFKYIVKTDISAGLTPLMRDA